MTVFRLSVTCFVVLLIGARLCSGFTYTSEKSIFSPPILNDHALRIMAGHLPGLVADFKVLHIFSVFGEHLEYPNQNIGDLIYADMKSATNLDPKFQDVYRLASSILAYDAHMPREAVVLLEKGTYAIPQSWEAPFLGAFIAYQKLSDNEKAFELMQKAISREGVPSNAAVLAAHFLKGDQSSEDAILFLNGLLDTMPEMYREGIQTEINRLRKSEK